MPNSLTQSHRLRTLHAILVLMYCAASAPLLARADENNPANNPSAREQSAVKGYLSKSALPDSVTLLPPPPAAGSVAMTLDETIAASSLELRGSARWKLAATDADVKFPVAAGTFSCALNAPITEADTPRLYTLLHRSLFDAGKSTSAAKNYYKRPRPFLINKAPICTPDEINNYAQNGSYPSGHAAVGWTWALILAELAPEQSKAVLARGIEYGKSRIVCNVHWYSDVVEGRVLATATVAQLHNEPAFRADMAAARQELTAARARRLEPVRDCALEAAALNESEIITTR